mgnify:CR=1 FL=1
MSLTAMVDEIGRAVSASVQRGLAPISRQVEELMAWRKAVGEIRNGIDGVKGDRGIDGKDGAAGRDGKDGANGRDGKDGVQGPAGKDAAPVDVEQIVVKVRALITDPKDGRDGRDGADGRDGVDGKPGLPGANGKDADVDAIVAKVLAQIPAPKDGKDGAQGVPGNGIKQFEYDAKDHTLDIVMDSGELFTLQLPAPERGEKGEPGLAGKDGAPGINGKDGADGVRGKDGEQGLRGEKGDVASPEEIAAVVTKACEAMLPALVAKQYETSMPEIIARASVLVPPGRDGLPGRAGTAGEPGKDGSSIHSIAIERSDKRSYNLIVRDTDGGRWELPMKLDGMVMDAGVHRPGEAYEKGDAVTHGGNYWVANVDTKASPGTSPDWRLVVRRGKDGKDAE